MGYIVCYSLFIEMLLFLVYAFPISSSSDTTTELHYDVVTNGNPSCVRIVLSCENQVISRAELFEQYSVAHVYVDIPTKKCGIIHFQLKNPQCDNWDSGNSVTFYGMYDNILFRSGGTASDPYEGSFSFMYGYLKNEDWYYNNKQFNIDNWYVQDLNDSSWKIYHSNNTQPIRSNDFYYRKDFPVLLDYTAYEMRFTFIGSITIILNNKTIVTNTRMKRNSNQNTTLKEIPELSFIRSGSELVKGKNSIAVHIQCEQCDISSFDSWLGLYHNSAEDCYVYPYPFAIVDIEEPTNYTKLQELNDLNIRSVSTLENGHIYGINFFSFYPSLSTLSFFIQYTSTINFNTLHITNEQEQLISHSYLPSFTDKSFSTISLSSSYSYQLLKIETNMRHSSILSELRLAITRQPVLQEVRFEHSEYTFYDSIQILPIQPVFTSIKQCIVMGTIPDGLSFANYCVLSGTPKQQGNFSLSFVSNGQEIGHLTIHVIACEDRFIRFLRVFGVKNSASEVFTIYDSNSKPVFSLDGRTREGTRVLQTLCLKREIYHVIVEDKDKDAWEENSYMQFDEYFWTSYVFNIRFRYDLPLNLLTDWVLDLTEMVSRGDEWYFYSKATIPLTWYDKSVTGWSLTSTTSAPITEAQFQIVKKDIQLNNPNLYNLMEIIVAFRAVCVIYFNDMEIYREGIADGVLITNITVAASESGKVVPHRIRHAVTSLKQHNWIAFALIQKLVGPAYSGFDASIRFATEPKQLRMDGCNTSYTSTSGRTPGEILILDSWKPFDWNRDWGQTRLRIYYNTENVDFVNCVELHTSFTTTNRKEDLHYGPNFFSIAGKTKTSEYDNLFMSDLIYVSPVLSVHTFCFDYHSKYRSFEILFNSYLPKWNVYSLQFFGIHIKKQQAIEYEYSLLVVDYEYACIHPLSLYLRSYSASGLPKGLVIDQVSGCLHGKITDEPKEYPTIISAKEYDGNNISTSIVFRVINCTDYGSLYSLSLYTLFYDYQTIQWHIDSNGEIMLSGSILAYSQSLTYIPLCLVDNEYTISLSSTINAHEVEVGFSYPALQYTFYTDFITSFPHSFHVNTRALISTTSSLRLFITQELPSTWYSIRFDDSIWQETNLSLITTVAPFLLLRKTITISDYTKYTGLSCVLHYLGGVAVYINEKLVIRNNLRLPITSTSRPITTQTSLSYSLNTINLVDNNITDSLLISILYSKQNNEKVFQFTPFIKLCVVDEFIQSSMNQRYYNPDMMKTNHNGIQEYQLIDLLKYPDVGFDWEFHNLEIMPVNELILQTSGVTNLQISFYCSNYESGETWKLLYHHTITQKPYEKTILSIPTAVIGCNRLSLLMHSDIITAYKFKIYQLYPAYSLRYTDSYCPNNGYLHATKENSSSPLFCNPPYRNIAFVTCKNEHFTSYDSSACFLPIPSSFTYSLPYTIAIGIPLPIISPSYQGEISNFFIYEKLPLGLALDSSSGNITGTITETQPSSRTIRIYGNNNNQVISTELYLSYEFLFCPKEGIWEALFPRTHVIKTSCNSLGKGIGVITRKCIVAHNTSSWDEQIEECTPSQSLFLILFVSFLGISILPGIISMCIRPKQKVSSNGV